MSKHSAPQQGERKLPPYVCEIASALLQTARQHEMALRQGATDSEHLHQYRVNLRKLRTLVGQLKPLFTTEQQHELAVKLSLITRQSNAARDLDVFQQQLSGYLQAMTSEQQQALDYLLYDVLQQHADAAENFLLWLASNEYQSTIKALEHCIDRLSNQSLDHGTVVPLTTLSSLVSDRVSKCYRNICSLQLQLDARSGAAEFHRLRIACKKMRYLLELFGAYLRPRALRAINEPLKQLQSSLGQANDAAVQVERLNQQLEAGKIAASSTERVATAALLELREQIISRQTSALDEALEQLARFCQIQSLQTCQHASSPQHD